MLKLKCFALASLGALALACSEDVDSNDVRTSGIYAEMEVLALGDGRSTVTVTLKPGGRSSNTYLVMEGEDELVATVDDASRALTKDGNGYQSEFDVEAGDTEFLIAFQRGPDDVSAMDSSVTLPDPFTLEAVADSVSRAEPLTVTWSPSGTDESMHWDLDGDCLFPESGSVNDSGTLTVESTDYDLHSGSEEETCPARLCLERRRSGQIDPAFGEGGEIVARQRRCVSFSSAP